MSKRPTFRTHPVTVRTARKVTLETPSEHAEQSIVISWWKLACHGYKLPEFALLAIPNGGARDQITGALLKAEGVRPGAPDLFLAAPSKHGHGLLLEMKRSDGGRHSPEQKAFCEHFRDHGYVMQFCHGADEAIYALKAYLS